MKIPTFCTITSLLGLALSSHTSLDATRIQQAFQEHTGVVCVPDLLAEGAAVSGDAQAVDLASELPPTQRGEATEDSENLAAQQAEQLRANRAF